MCPFKVGQEVVCISSKFSGGYGTEQIPRKGHMYTIARVVPDNRYGHGLTLVEVRNPECLYRFTDGDRLAVPLFDWRAFRPLNTREELYKSVLAVMSEVKQALGDKHADKG